MQDTNLNKFYADLYETLISIFSEEELIRFRKRLDLRQRREPSNNVKDFVLMEELTNELVRRELAHQIKSPPLR